MRTGFPVGVRRPVPSDWSPLAQRRNSLRRDPKDTIRHYLARLASYWTPVCLADDEGDVSARPTTREDVATCDVVLHMVRTTLAACTHGMHTGQ